MSYEQIAHIHYVNAVETGQGYLFVELVLVIITQQNDPVTSGEGVLSYLLIRKAAHTRA
jgi:hypothetical protein